MPQDTLPGDARRIARSLEQIEGMLARLVPVLIDQAERRNPLELLLSDLAEGDGQESGMPENEEGEVIEAKGGELDPDLARFLSPEQMKQFAKHGG